MTNSQCENSNQNQRTPRIRPSLLDNTSLVESPEGYDGDDWTFRKQLEADFQALQFKSRKFSHEKEPEARLADSLWLTWHRVSRNSPTGAAVDSIEVRVTFTSPETSDSSGETTVNINCYGRGNKSCLPYGVEKMKLVLKNNDTTDLFHHIHHFMTKPRPW